MFTSATTQIPNNVLLQVHSRLPGDWHFPPDLGTTAPSQPRGPVPAQQRPAFESMQGRDEGQRMKTSQCRRVRIRELDWFWTLSYKDQQSSQSKDGWTNTPARTRGPTQSGNNKDLDFTEPSCVTEPHFWVWQLNHPRTDVSTSCLLQSNIQSVHCACVLESLFLLSRF